MYGFAGNGQRKSLQNNNECIYLWDWKQWGEQEKSALVRTEKKHASTFSSQRQLHIDHIVLIMITFWQIYEKL